MLGFPDTATRFFGRCETSARTTSLRSPRCLGEYRYRVVSTSIVSPNDGAVLDPGEDQILTLVTCYPFYFVGPAPRRFIVRAERVANAL